MSLKHFVESGVLLGTALAFSGVMSATPAASSSAQPGGNSREASILLKDIRNDALKIGEHASRWENLSSKPAVQWRAYDRQWNLIKPPQEDISVKLTRLRDMRASLSPSERQAVDRSLPLYRNIAANTHNLRSLLTKPNVKLTDARFRTDSAMLAKEARQLAETAKTTS